LEHARQGAVTPPRELNRCLSRPLERIVMRALAADPAQRFASAAEMRQTLHRYRFRHRRRAMVAGLVAVVGLVLGTMFWPKPDPQREVPPPAPAPRPAPKPASLSGELTVRVWSLVQRGKRGLKVEEPGALPLLPGELVHLEARLNQPAYAYLLWLDGQGQVSLLYPRDDGKFGSRPSGNLAQETVHSPEALDGGHKMTGPGGLETALLLVRRTPLPPNIDLAGLIGRLPPAMWHNPLEVARRGFDEGQPIEAIKVDLHRAIGEEMQKIDEPLLNLMERLRRDFVVIQAVRFAYRGE
jgi:hypothetical protein